MMEHSTNCKDIAGFVRKFKIMKNGVVHIGFTTTATGETLSITSSDGNYQFTVPFEQVAALIEATRREFAFNANCSGTRKGGE